ncbi:MAG TPA: hypothetical protein VL126_17055 [Bacteroidota bacterium]|nr:hypothetical protein [Bacteroidota bacterium]
MELLLENDSVRVAVDRMTEDHLVMWSNAPVCLPSFFSRFSAEQKAEKEREIEQMLEKTPPPSGRFEELDEPERKRLLGRAHTAIAKLLSTPRDAFTEQFFDHCEKAGRAFSKEAREFDPALKDEEVQQALRNQWVFNSIQSCLDHPVTLSPSSLAYSLMYPYTDNWLDAQNRTAAEKRAYIETLTPFLEGHVTENDDPGVQTLLRLLQMVEEEYPRADFPEVYGSLLAIHRAQERGILLHAPVDELADVPLLAITVEKGGTSVLVDGYLVRGTLTQKEQSSLFGYGVLLQFIDDLQDIAQDERVGHSNAFSCALREGPLDAITNRLIHFTRGAIARMDGGPGAQNASLRRLIEDSCMFLIWEAIARHRAHYSPSYLRSIEEYAPLRFEYLDGLHTRLKKKIAQRERTPHPG